MTLKQVFDYYDRRAHKAVDLFKYCPFCQTPLQLQEIGHRLRPTCPGCRFVQFSNPAPAISVLIAEEDRVLLGKRLEPPGEGQWAIPSGYVEWEDDYLTTAIREAREETGLEVEIESVLNVVSSFLAPRWHFLAVYVLARPIGGELAAGDDLEQVAWFSVLEPLPELAFVEDAAMLELLAAGGLVGLPVDPEFARPPGRGEGN
jgi:8-oxo-dGTP diphosphatase